MSVFDELLSAVWSTAREDGGALLAAFAPPGSDRQRAELALRLPQLGRVRELLSGAGEAETGAKDVGRGERALVQAGRERGLDAVLALSEAIRFLPDDQLLDVMERRALALLELQEPRASLLDLERVRELVVPDLQRKLRILLAISSCFEMLGELPRAETFLREALAEVRDAGMETSTKSEAVCEIVRRINGIRQHEQQVVGRSRVSSGLNAVPSLCGGEHPSLPSAAAALDLRLDKKRGRHLVTNRSIAAGSVLIVERPFAWSLLPGQLSSHCLHCCSPVLAPLPCPHCSSVVFCSRSCLDAALPCYHLVECPVLAHLCPGGGELSTMALLVFRIVMKASGLATLIAAEHPGADQPGHHPEGLSGPRLGEGRTVALSEAFVNLFLEHPVRETKKKKKKKSRGRKDTHGYEAVFEQVTHSESRTPADLLKRSLTAAYLTCCLEESLRGRGLELGPEQAVVLTTAFLRHLQSCSCNAYQVCEQRGVREAVELGGACYPTVSLVNHACSPNVARHSHGTVCVVRATRNIPEGAELLDNYGPHFLEMDREERRAALAKQYFFHCDCEACQHDWPPLEGLDQGLDQGPPQGGHGGNRIKTKLVAQVDRLSSELTAGVQGILEGRVEEALRSALKYSAVLEQLRGAQRPPCRELVRANQVAALCWSLAGNTVQL